MKEPRKKLEFRPDDLDFSDEAMSAMMTSNPRAAPPAPPPPPVEPPTEPEIERQQLGVRIDKAVYKRLRLKAVTDEVLVQVIVERAIRELLDREE